MKTGYFSLLLIILVLFAGACNTLPREDRKADSNKKTVQEKPGEVQPPEVQNLPVHAKKVSFVIDNTGSSPEDQFQEPTNYSKSALTEVENIIFVDVSNIGKDGKQTWEPTRQHFDFPVKPINKFDETQATALAKERGCGNRLACLKREVEKMRKQSEVEYKNDMAAYNETRRNLIEQVGQAILQSPTKSPVCSDIQEQAEFVAQLPTDAVIWLTDGQHNCKTTFTGIEFKNKAVLLLILPVKNEMVGGFRKRFDELTAKFHNAKVKPITSVNKEVLFDFLAQ